MPLSIKVDLGLGHIVLDGNPAPLPKKGAHHPNFRPMSVVGLWPNGWWIKMPLGTEAGLGPGYIVLVTTDGDRAPRKKGHVSPHFSAHVSCD